MKQNPAQKRQRERKATSWRLYCQQSLKYIENLLYIPPAYSSATDLEDGFIPDAALTVGQENHDRGPTMHVSVSDSCS
jgi:hypothetical protein